jgi:hypothetical protein
MRFYSNGNTWVREALWLADGQNNFRPLAFFHIYILQASINRDAIINQQKITTCDHLDMYNRMVEKEYMKGSTKNIINLQNKTKRPTHLYLTPWS